MSTKESDSVFNDPENDRYALLADESEYGTVVINVCLTEVDAYVMNIWLEISFSIEEETGLDVKFQVFNL